MRNNSKIYTLVIVFYLALIALSAFFVLYFGVNLLLTSIIIVGSIFIVLFTIVETRTYNKSVDSIVQDTIEEGEDSYLNAAEVGIVVYDDKYQIKSMSEYFKQYGIYDVGKVLYSWVPELQELVNEETAKKTIILNDKKFSVTKDPEKNVLYFKDITEKYDLKKQLQENSYVVGFASFDNIDDSNDDENYNFAVSNIKANVFNYFKNFNICYKTLKNNVIYLILNEKQLNNLIQDHFSILKTIKANSNKENIYITLSLSFAYGSNDYNELDNIAYGLLETAKNRGGDQAIIKKINENEQYYGGYSEARGEKSKTRLRVIYNTLKNILSDECHSNVFIVCHNDADSDCVGSAICMSILCAINKKEVYIVLNNVSIEPMINDVLNKYKNEINEDYRLISPNEAMSLMNDKSLIIMVDHNDKNQSSGIDLLNRDKDVIIFDHHRRRNDLNVKSIFNYIEAGASSCVEIITELFDYAPNNFEVKKYEANIMYLGMLIDTNNFKNRVGMRTFEVAAKLKEYGADQVECQNFINEPIDVVLNRSHIIENAKALKDNIIIS